MCKLVTNIAVQDLIAQISVPDIHVYFCILLTLSSRNPKFA
jgi:hypothetical protein